MTAEGVIFDVKELAVHDGPGIRATVFFKGCPLACRWCHNPEGILPHPQLMASSNGCTGCGRCRIHCPHPECAPFHRCARACPKGLLRIAGTRIGASALADRLHRLAPLLEGGGITLSGGEPLFQPAFLLDLLERFSPMDTLLETSGYASPEVFRAAAAACGTVYLDIKHSDPRRHRELTGVDNGPILLNLEWLKSRSAPFLIRVPLIPGCNDDLENLEGTARLLSGAKGLIGVELLPYNPYAGAKYRQLDMPFPMDESPSPTLSPPSGDPLSPFLRRGIPCRIL